MHFLLCCWSNFLECVQTRCPQPVNRSYSRKQQGANKKLDKWIDSRTTCGGNGMMAAHAPVPSPHMSWYVAHLRFACLLTLTDLLRLANPPASILCYDSANCQVISLLFFFPISCRPSFMDPDWFGYATSGTLIVSWAGASGRASREPHMGFSGSVLETPFSQHAPSGSRGNQRATQGGSPVDGAR